jgi:hypothetical protein
MKISSEKGTSQFAKHTDHIQAGKQGPVLPTGISPAAQHSPSKRSKGEQPKVERPLKENAVSKKTASFERRAKQW